MVPVGSTQLFKASLLERYFLVFVLYTFIPSESLSLIPFTFLKASLIIFFPEEERREICVSPMECMLQGPLNNQAVKIRKTLYCTFLSLLLSLLLQRLIFLDFR